VNDVARPKRSILLGAIVLALVIVPFILFGDRIEAWSHTVLLDRRPAGPWPAVLCVVLLVSDVLLPVPSSLVSTACGLWWGLWAGTALSALGMTLGSVLGYAIGRYAQSARRWVGEAEVARLERLFARHGEWIVVVLRPVPVLAEASAVFAGFSRMAIGRYMALSVAANVCVSLFYAGLGALIQRRAPAAGMLVLLLLLAGVAVAGIVARRAGLARPKAAPRGYDE
jgi:uncharacterized membrane protein YdjX (TVP38/TMEM64 family)